MRISNPSPSPPRHLRGGSQTFGRLTGAIVALASIAVTSIYFSTMLSADDPKSDKSEMAEVPPVPEGAEVAVLGAGCFWCVEAVLEQQDGIIHVTSGYMGGHVKNPTYEQICRKDTGHAEVVRVVFDPKKLPYEHLLKWFWKLHDPTTLNRQGNDVGPQYRSAIFYYSDQQKAAAEKSKTAEDKSGNHKAPIVTEITKASTFYPAEKYHQEYYRNNKNQGYCRFVILPKLQKLNLEH